MTTQRHPTIGACPNCDAEIPATDVLIEYRTSDGDRGSFAECPGCQAVVHPG